MPEADNLVQLRHLTKQFPLPRQLGAPRAVVHAVEELSLDIPRGRIVALVGESGSGKSTVAKLLLRLIEATSGEIQFDGTDIRKLGKAELRGFRRRMQIIF